MKYRVSPGFIWTVGLGIAFAWGLGHAIAWRWMCDDAYIVLRYAKNFANGLGLVYNAGERVEGYTDLAWVVWTSLAFRFGVTPEKWSQISGVLCYAGTILLLGWWQLRRRPLIAPAVALPVAALLAAFHPDLNIYATSGLEASAFTFLLVAGYVSTLSGHHGAAAAARTAALFALASLVRPDGVLPALCAGFFFLAWGAPRIRSALVYLAVFLLIWGPVQVWRVSYYGDFFPNTYYTKSAMLAWWSQGWLYVRFYFQKYWFFLLALPGFVMASFRTAPMEATRREPYREGWLPEVLLCAAIAVTYTLYIARVGGDFMYARMLIPTTPFYALLVELAMIPLAPFWSRWSLGLLTLFGLWAFVKTPPPDMAGGLANEWAFYRGYRERATDSHGRNLKRYFDGLPVRILVFGTEARLAYRSEAAFALEGNGLADRYVGRLPLLTRGRPGHEKLAPVPYVIDEKKVHFVFVGFGFPSLHFPDFVPSVPISFGNTGGHVLRWDAPLMAELKRRGAVFPDYPAAIDHYIENAFHCPADEVAGDFARFRRFYFDANPDPPREALFREMMERGSALPPDTRP